MNFGHAALYQDDRIWKGALSAYMNRRTLMILVLSPSLAFAHSTKIGTIAIGHSWALPSTGPEAQVMMPLVNSGVTVDELIGATSPIAAHIELQNANAVLVEFTLEPKKPFPMRAAAYHLHLFGLTQPIEVGDKFPLTLTFKSAGQIEIQIHVSAKAGE